MNSAMTFSNMSLLSSRSDGHIQSDNMGRQWNGRMKSATIISSILMILIDDSKSSAALTLDLRGVAKQDKKDMEVTLK